MHSMRSLVLFLLVAVPALSACDDDSTDLEPIHAADVTEVFEATTFTVKQDGQVQDQLALGATFEITLADDGTTSGHLHVPDADEGGGDLEADLVGTFDFDDSSDEITFDQDADTFVRDMMFEAVRVDDEVRLQGEKDFDGATIKVVLAPAS
jgi:hypothetical protein